MKTISAVRDTQGNVLQYVALFSDITPIKEHEKQLEQIAHYDVLTTLPNRVLLADRLHQAMVHASRYRQILAAACLDLDGFKAINDTYGHEVGDLFLADMAERLRGAARAQDFVARYGGDEFVAVGPGPAPGPALEAARQGFGQRLAQATRGRFGGADAPIDYAGASVGVIAALPSDMTADDALREADRAMYAAKKARRAVR